MKQLFITLWLKFHPINSQRNTLVETRVFEKNDKRTHLFNALKECEPISESLFNKLLDDIDSTNNKKTVL
jgi:hypothetical protein